MTMTSYDSLEQAPALGIAHVLNGSRLLMRMVFKLGAVSFALVAFLVWFAPGATWESDVMLFKLALSFMAVFISIGMWQRSVRPEDAFVEVDIAKMEIRVIRKKGSQPCHVIERCAFGDLENVDLKGRHIIMWCKGERLLADITLSNATAHASLLGALRRAGKLALCAER